MSKTVDFEIVSKMAVYEYMVTHLGDFLYIQGGRLKTTVPVRRQRQEIGLSSHGNS